jgi:hypothetical protein
MQNTRTVPQAKQCHIGTHAQLSGKDRLCQNGIPRSCRTHFARKIPDFHDFEKPACDSLLIFSVCPKTGTHTIMCGFGQEGDCPCVAFSVTGKGMGAVISATVAAGVSHYGI